MELVIIKRTDPRILKNMDIHYSQPKGFVGRNICYAITHDNLYYGSIVGGSCTRFLVGRNEFFGLINPTSHHMNCFINNIFFHCEKVDGKYPFRNFTVAVLTEWRRQVTIDWRKKYRNIVEGFETLIELPRTGECYKRDGWTLVGKTKGQTCKREAGKGTDDWSGKRVWDTVNLRPKLVFCRKV